jgi:hypothetical protein
MRNEKRTKTLRGIENNPGVPIQDSTARSERETQGLAAAARIFARHHGDMT